MSLQETGIAIDTEYWQNGQEITPYFISGYDGTTKYIWPMFSGKETFLADAKKYLEDPTIPKYFHNAKADLKTLWVLGIDVKNIAFDTMLAAYVLNPVNNGIGLKKLTKEIFNYDMIDYHDRFKKGETFLDIYNQNPVEATQYALDDAIYTYKLVELFKPKIDAKFADVYYNIELPLVEILTKMELCGIKVDREMLKGLKDRYQIEANNLEEELKRIANPIVRSV